MHPVLGNAGGIRSDAITRSNIGANAGANARTAPQRPFRAGCGREVEQVVRRAENLTLVNAEPSLDAVGKMPQRPERSRAALAQRGGGPSACSYTT
jgi:hypothetical protein